MYTLSTRTLSALAYERGEEYDPGQPICPALIEDLELLQHASPVIGEEGPYERRRRAERERKRQQRAAAQIPTRRRPRPQHRG